MKTEAQVAFPRLYDIDSIDAPLMMTTAHLRAILYILSFVSDIVAIAAGFLLPITIFSREVPEIQNVLYLPAIVIAFASLGVANGLYTFRSLQSLRTSLRSALLPLIVAMAIVCLLPNPFFPMRYPWLDIFGTQLLTAAGLIAFGKLGLAKLQSKILPTGLLSLSVLQDRERGEVRHPHRVVHPRQHGLNPDIDDPIMLEKIGMTFRNYDRVIVDVDAPRIEPWCDVLRGLGLEVEVILPGIETLKVLSASEYEGRFTAMVAHRGLPLSDRVVKRAFDVCFVLAALPVLSIVFLVIALAIKIDDGGPVYFRQKRIGRGNCTFELLKFRSMYVHHADYAGAQSVSKSDLRVTRVGRFLRATSLDELPQLINVLTGSMSLVGPRPHAPASTVEHELFWQVDKRYWLRHTLKPGLTGLAQIRGFRGGTFKKEDLLNRLHADLEYLSNWSLYRDILIILSTFLPRSHQNAY